MNASIERVTAGLAEERRRDREEYRQLWRDTQSPASPKNLAAPAANSARESTR